MSSALPYTPDQQRRALGAISSHWAELVTRAGLSGQMHPPTFSLHVNRNWGMWFPQRRELSIHARLAVELQGHADWADTIAHEVAHQWADEVAHASHEPPHGSTWRRGARLFGAHPQATACCQLEALCAPPSDADAQIIRRVQKLLALSDSANPHEAELATLNARKLIAKHNLAPSVPHLSSPQPVPPQRWAYQTLGVPIAKRPLWLFMLARILQDHFHVQGIWLRYPDLSWDAPSPPAGASTRWLLEITGTPASVAIAAHVFAFLQEEAQRRLRDYLSSRASADRPRTARLDFLEGFFLGFRQKLDAQKAHLQAQWAEEASTRALIPLADAALLAFHRSRYPRIHRSTASRPLSDVDAHAEGKSQGQQTRLHHAVEDNARGLLLPK
jgi:hypothetical protein